MVAAAVAPTRIAAAEQQQPGLDAAQHAGQGGSGRAGRDLERGDPDEDPSPTGIGSVRRTRRERRDEERRVGRADSEECHHGQRERRCQSTARQGQCDDRRPSGWSAPRDHPRNGRTVTSSDPARLPSPKAVASARAGRWIQTESRGELDGDHRQATEHQSGRHGGIGDSAQRAEGGEQLQDGASGRWGDGLAVAAAERRHGQGEHARRAGRYRPAPTGPAGARPQPRGSPRTPAPSEAGYSVGHCVPALGAPLSLLVGPDQQPQPAAQTGGQQRSAGAGQGHQNHDESDRPAARGPARPARSEHRSPPSPPAIRRRPSLDRSSRAASSGPTRCGAVSAATSRPPASAGRSNRPVSTQSSSRPIPAPASALRASTADPTYRASTDICPASSSLVTGLNGDDHHFDTCTGLRHLSRW